ncbi:acyltransferase 3 [Hymenobacter roseosalivarius DSM 11622]|uniref:Acyltransferase 3 n=1 Tax=Hymenobacter roseosalivarius DSM 11622 TaxID=645990 RepID=A0A1W1W3R5_9BACT|nr:acyltransferase [Hymenobacter roseosalivarius]SMC00278.1 acyltransferase 3 [Hymenobacter roseosalivarius DSM 11622]
MIKQYYKPLTGIRAIAAFMVYLHHYNPGKLIFGSQALKYVFHEFHVGVTIFFTLSGFLITERYFTTENFSPKNIKTYLLNRFTRIYPLYIILTLPVFFIAFNNVGFSRYYLYALILNITLLKSLSLEYAFTGLPQSWSLSVEEFFYLFAVFFFPFLNSNRGRKGIIWISAIVLLPFMGFLSVTLFNQLHLPFFENLSFVAYSTFFGRFYEFFIGAGLALYLMRSKTNYNFGFITYSGIILFALGVFALMKIKEVYGLNFGTSHPIGIAVNNLYLPLCIAIIFLGLFREESFISKLLSTKVFSVLGKSSYAFYLIHMGLIHELLTPYFNEKSTAGAIAIYLVLVALSIAVYYLFEEPANKKIRSIASRWLTHTSSSSTSALSKPSAR